MVTAADILKIVPITRKTLWLWQKKYKFFPDPKKKVHPGGKGIVGYYPAWVKERCVTIFSLQKKGYTVPMIKEVLEQEEKIKSTKKILIVGDEKVFAETLKKFLLKNGFLIELASDDGWETGLKLADFMPSIMLVDIDFPGLSGVEMCRRLKSNSKTQYIRIIAISGNLRNSEASILEAGAEIFLKKPIDVCERMSLSLPFDSDKIGLRSLKNIILNPS